MGSESDYSKVGRNLKLRGRVVTDVFHAFDEISDGCNYFEVESICVLNALEQLIFDHCREMLFSAYAEEAVLDAIATDKLVQATLDCSKSVVRKAVGIGRDYPHGVILLMQSPKVHYTIEHKVGYIYTVTLKKR